MRAFVAAFTTVGLALLPLSASAAAVHPHHHTSAQAMVRHSSMSHSRRTEHAASAYTGSSMSSERATEIQSALIKNGYLSGEPTGSWDAGSVAAMQKMQGDNGWQTKLTPDSRALIKLGLGPNTTPAATPSNAMASVDTPAAH